MIRTACLAALVAGTLLGAQSASATVNLSDRISQVINGLRKNSTFSARDFSFTLNRASGGVTYMFTGIEGVRVLNGTDFTVVNDWVDEQPVPNGPFNGGGYTFTHEVLDSVLGDPPEPQSPFNGGGYTFTHEVIDRYFGDAPQDEGEDESGQTSGGVFNGGGYTFTHEVLNSYFPDEPEQEHLLIAPPVEQQAAVMPVPEPASWAMMIGGFALVGAALRGRRAAVRIA